MSDKTTPPAQYLAKFLAFAEIISILLSCLIAEWVFLSFFRLQRWLIMLPIAIALGYMLLSHRAYKESPRELGFRFDNLIPALRLVLWPTLIAVVVVVAVGWYLTGAPALDRLLRPRLLLVPAWALVQQYALQGFINRRAQVALGKTRWSVVMVAVVFAMLHLPNPALSGLTLIGGLIWAATYQREANLFALAASHTVASLSLAMAIPLNVINGLRVGFKYFG